MFFVFRVTINGKQGYATIVNDQVTKRFFAECKKEIFSSDDFEECKNFIQENGLVYDAHKESQPVNNDLWHDF